MGNVNFRIYPNRILRGGQRLIIITARQVDLRATQMGAQMHWIQTEDVLHVIQREGKLLLAKFYRGNGQMSGEGIGIELQSGLQFRQSLFQPLFFHQRVRCLDPVVDRLRRFRQGPLYAFDLWLERSHTNVRFASVGNLLILTTA